MTTTLNIISGMFDTCERVWMPQDGFVENAIKNDTYQGSIVGSLNLYSPKLKTSFCLPVDGWIPLPISPSSVARKVLMQGILATGKKRIEQNRNNKHLKDMSHPLFFKPYIGQGLYIDLKSAYWQIYSKLPIHFYFNGEIFTGRSDVIGQIAPDDWKDYKLARNSLAGLFRADSVARIRNYRIEKDMCNPPTFSPSHWGFIQSILHWIAAVAVQHGAVYVYTDGYIFPENSPYEAFTRFLDGQSIRWDVKAKGRTSVTGIGRYEIGDFKTKSTSTCEPLDKVSKGVNMEKNWQRLLSIQPY